jgi:glycerol-3-phosphate dehydrogenase
LPALPKDVASVNAAGRPISAQLLKQFPRNLLRSRQVETAFALMLTVSGGDITSFRMLEDSFAVSRAARP